MYRLGLIHETMLVTTAPGPTLVLDQSLAGPARAGRLAASDTPHEHLEYLVGRQSGL